MKRNNLRIAIDARLYGLEHAGPGRYVLNLINELARTDSTNQYEVLLRKRYFHTLDLPSKWRKHLVDVRHYSLKEQFTVNSILKDLRPDIVHFPHFNVPVRYNDPFVVTIHDLSKHRSKGKESTTLPYYAYLVKRFGYSTVFRHAVMKSKSILVPSNYVKKDVVETYKVPSNKITVTYEGVGINTEADSEIDIVRKFSLNVPYFLFVGSAYPHKNLDRLIEAIVYVNERLGRKSYLVISSSRTIFTNRLEHLIREKKAGEYVKLLGFVSDDELVSLYRSSIGLVYPTLMEGFGLPGLEAMGAGTLVLCSDIPVLKEIYHDNALYFNPYDFTAIGKVMNDALELKRIERKARIGVGKEFIKRYSWSNMAKETLKVYEQSAVKR